VRLEYLAKMKTDLSGDGRLWGVFVTHPFSCEYIFDNLVAELGREFFRIYRPIIAVEKKEADLAAAPVRLQSDLENRMPRIFFSAFGKVRHMPQPVA
jgi:hypothetical protein